MKTSKTNSITLANILRFIVGFSVVIIVFQQLITKALSPSISNFDEALILFFFVLSPILIIFQRFTTGIYIYTTFSILAIISLLFGKAQPSTSLIQLFIHFKFFFLFIAFFLLYRSQKGQHQLRSIFNLIVVVTIIGFFINLFLQEKFFILFNTKIEDRGGLLRIFGFQLKPNDLAILLGVHYIYLMSESEDSLSIYKKIIFTFLYGIFIFLNGSRVGLVSIPLALLILSTGKARFYSLWALVGILIITLSLSLEYFEFLADQTVKNFGEFKTIEQSQYIRGIMIYYGFVLFIQYFPIGAGSATFGSVMSFESPVYVELRLHNMSFFQNLEGIYDSNLATIMGEFGLIGIVLFAFLWMKIVNESRKLHKTVKNNERYLMALSIYMLIIILTNPFFMYQYNSVIFVIALILGPRSSKK
ncbi:MAG: hypothetical protein H6974_10045 [Gammaproteobacteria bacterium]|nr:hypothetical protein [Gammaproteobacteria bacterium]